MRLALALAMVLSGITLPASAQTSHVFHEDERRAQLEGETIAMHVLYGASALIGVWTLSAGSIAIVDAGAPACIGSCSRQEVEAAIAFSGFGSLAVGAILMFVAIGLDVDVRGKRRGLGSVSIRGGPGDLGLALTLALE